MPSLIVIIAALAGVSLLCLFGVVGLAGRIGAVGSIGMRRVLQGARSTIPKVPGITRSIARLVGKLIGVLIGTRGKCRLHRPRANGHSGASGIGTASMGGDEADRVNTVGCIVVHRVLGRRGRASAKIPIPSRRILRSVAEGQGARRSLREIPTRRRRRADRYTRAVGSARATSARGREADRVGADIRIDMAGIDRGADR